MRARANLPAVRLRPHWRGILSAIDDPLPALLLVTSGLVAIVYGLALVSVPAALIVGGLLAVVSGIGYLRGAQ